jgi:hypothetical protein
MSCYHFAEGAMLSNNGTVRCEVRSFLSLQEGSETKSRFEDIRESQGVNSNRLWQRL